jgi:hypothetical protein
MTRRRYVNAHVRRDAWTSERQPKGRSIRAPAEEVRELSAALVRDEHRHSRPTTAVPGRVVGIERDQPPVIIQRNAVRSRVKAVDGFSSVGGSARNVRKMEAASDPNVLEGRDRAAPVRHPELLQASPAPEVGDQSLPRLDRPDRSISCSTGRRSQERHLNLRRPTNTTWLCPISKFEPELFDVAIRRPCVHGTADLDVAAPDLDVGVFARDEQARFGDVSVNRLRTCCRSRDGEGARQRDQRLVHLPDDEERGDSHNRVGWAWPRLLFSALRNNPGRR